MSGYVDYSMSQNAARAYREGKMPASKLARRLKVSAQAVKAILPRSEWHHCSGHYNAVDFYDPDDVTPEQLSAMKRLSERQKKDAKIVERFRAQVTWLEWSGSRKHPIATEYSEIADVALKGQTYTITLNNGRTFRKRVGCTGLKVKVLK